MERELKSPGSKERKQAKERRAAVRGGLSIRRYFTTPGVDPADEMAWELRTAGISGEDGKVVFEQKDVEIPKSWSQMATNVVVSKYFRGTLGTPERETSVRQLIGARRRHHHRLGTRRRLLHDRADGDPSATSSPPPPPPEGGVQLAGLVQRRRRAASAVLGLLHQLRRRHDGLHPRPGQDRGHALQVRLGHRHEPLPHPLARKELLAGGGTASGPVSFMRGFDAFAGVIKSGGKTRRAAKMVILNADHPDILDFIDCKANEEKKAWALIDAGYDGGFNGEAYDSVYFQNANHSVRVTDEFMKAVERDGDGRPARSPTVSHGDLRARDSDRKIAEAA